MADIIVDVKSSGTASAYVNAPFDEGKEDLESAEYSVISLQRNAQLRMQQGATADVSKYGNWTREGVIYVPSKCKFLTKNSPIMANAKEATDCHRKGKEFYLTPEQVEQSLADSVELSVKALLTDRFGEDEITAYAFGEDAKKYGEFLKEAGIESMPIWPAYLIDKAFARQMWFRWLDSDDRSALDGGYWDLFFSSRLRGVKDSAEGTAQKSPAQIKTPNVADILQYTKRFVPEAVRAEFERGLVEKLKQ